MSGAMQNTIVGFRQCHENAVFPAQRFNTDAAYDVHTIEDGVVPPGQVKSFKTGLMLSMCDRNFHPQLCSRSGLAMNAGVIVIGGIIDSGYRGEIVVVLLNTGATEFVVKAGSRVAQMRFVQIAHPQIAWMNQAPSDRGSNGFGSTGIQ